MTSQESAWKRVRQALRTAKGIAFDGCHKIYILMDDEQVETSVGHGGYNVQPVDDVDEAVATVRKWYEDSCPLKFVNAVSTVTGDPSSGYLSLIDQFEFEGAS